MAHFAKVVDGIVTQVIVADQEFMDSYVDSSPGEWIQTSYNTRFGKHYAPNSNIEDDKPPLRKNFAWVGGTYDKTRDAFLPPKPFPSWTLNEETCIYEPPYPMPDDSKYYDWDEDMKYWKEAT